MPYHKTEGRGQSLPSILALRNTDLIFSTRQHYQRSRGHSGLLPLRERELYKRVHRPAFPGRYPSNSVFLSLLLFFPRRRERPCLRLPGVQGDPPSQYTRPSKRCSSQNRQALGVPSLAIEGQIVQPNKRKPKDIHRYNTRKDPYFVVW